MSRPKCPTNWQHYGVYWRNGYEAGVLGRSCEVTGQDSTDAAYAAGHTRGLWEYYGISVKRTECGYAVMQNGREVSRQATQSRAFHHANTMVTEAHKVVTG